MVVIFAWIIAESANWLMIWNVFFALITGSVKYMTILIQKDADPEALKEALKPEEPQTKTEAEMAPK